MQDDTPRPDFGVMLTEIVRPDADVQMADFTMFDISQAEEELFTTTSNAHWGGEVYAASVDFDPAAFETLCGLLGPFGEWLSNAFSTPFEGSRKAPFPQPLTLNLRAKLGAPVELESETFVPLLVQEVELG